MRNLLRCKYEDLLKTENLSIHEFMGTMEEVAKLFDVYVDEDTTEKFSPFEWFVMVLNYMGREYVMDEKIAHYLQFMDKLNGIHSTEPMYPTILFHEKKTERNEVLLGAYNFYHFMSTDRDEILENILNV